jgi:hypothetical protein
MAIQSITYDNKTALNLNNDIPDINKVTANDMNEIKAVVNNNATELSNLPSTIIESSSDATGGYLKFSDGTIIQWKQVNATLGGNAWSNLWYSDHTMGDWEIPFTTLYLTYTSVNLLQYWCTGQYATTTSAGQIRVFRPTDQTAQGTVAVIGVGRWQ